MNERQFRDVLMEIAGLDKPVFKMGAQRYCSQCRHPHELREVDQRPSWGRCLGVEEVGCTCHVLYPESPASRARRALAEM